MRGRAPVGVDVVAMQAKANRSAELSVGTPAVAVRQLSPVLPSLVDRGFYIHPGLRFLKSAFSLRLMLRARAKLDGTRAVVVAFHGRATDALAVAAALPVVPFGVAEMAVHCSSCKCNKKLKNALLSSLEMSVFS